uniref:Uncharacterized protein n=1 Tax=Arcella intermedia TaxID=1963864 RepID=A0A6B2LIZ0_9EUKA
MIHRWVTEMHVENPKPTRGLECKEKDIIIGSKTVSCKIWDIAGQEKYDAVTRSYFRDAHGALVVCDISARATFDNLINWLMSVRQKGGANVKIVVVGNKRDLAFPEVEESDMNQFCLDNNIQKYFISSAYTNTNVEEAFVTLCEEIVNDNSPKTPTSPPNSKSQTIKLEPNTNTPPKSPSCC